jgi:hypothetical protein
LASSPVSDAEAAFSAALAGSDGEVGVLNDRHPQLGTVSLDEILHGGRPIAAHLFQLQLKCVRKPLRQFVIPILGKSQPEADVFA